jgi:hypothetical protein
MHALQNSPKTWQRKIVKVFGFAVLIYQTLSIVVFEYVDDVYVFEIKHVCKLNWK